MCRKGKAVSNNARLQRFVDVVHTYSFGSPDTLDLREQFLPYRIVRMWHRIFKDMLWASGPALRMMKIVNEDDGSTDVEEKDAREKDVAEGQVAVKEEKLDLD